MAGIFLVFYSFTKDLIDASLESNQVTIKGVLGLWHLTPLSTIFQLYRGSQFYWWMKPEYEWPLNRGCHGHDRMVVGFTTTCVISVYHH
jgi:hypothetical protein